MERINCTCYRATGNGTHPDRCVGVFPECKSSWIPVPSAPVISEKDYRSQCIRTPEEDEKFRTFNIIEKCGTIAYLCSLLDPMHPHELTDINFHLRAIQNIIYARKTIQHEPPPDIQPTEKTSQSGLY